MPESNSRHIGRLSLLGATLIWGSSFIILKSTLDSVPTLWVLAFRFSGAALLMALIGAKELKKLDSAYLVRGLGLGAALFAAYTLQTFGLEHTTPGKNAFLTATYCVIVPFMWWLFSRKRPDAYNLAAALICICGMALVSLDGSLTLGLGDGLTICCGFFYALHIILTARRRGAQPCAALHAAIRRGGAAVLDNGALCLGLSPGRTRLGLVVHRLSVLHLHRHLFPPPDHRPKVHLAADGFHHPDA